MNTIGIFFSVAAAMGLSTILGRAEVGRPSGEEVLALRTLGLLQGELRDAADPEARRQIGRKILIVGDPLVAGPMGPPRALEMPPAFKSGRKVPGGQDAYFAFWLVRAMGAISVNDTAKGIEAAVVLQILGATDSGNEAALAVMSALNVKGWLSSADPRTASMIRPFTNTLGMRFVPIPGTKVLFSIWVTRVKDYAAFAKDANGVDDKWQHPEDSDEEQKVAIVQSDDHPVICVNANDAEAFCKWLSKKESRTYRLPTDLEWSAAAGLAPEDPESEPFDRYLASMEDDAPTHYSWGDTWPPPANAGNFDADLNKDQFRFTSPVASFPPNKFGLFDISGNVEQWCSDSAEADKYDKPRQIVRGIGCAGGSKPVHPPDYLLARRMRGYLGDRDASLGFRVALELPSE